ncbi:MAG: anthranilate synthase component I [Verrucomicrobia bacterium]|nr:anthranilate synthase component I [Verrucomicrobiota bacterium]
MISPSLAEFQKLAGQGNLIPVTTRILADIETPLSAYRKIRGQGESFLFESVEGGEHLGRYSFVGCNPRAVIKQTENRIEVIQDGKVVEKFEVRSAPVPGAAIPQTDAPRKSPSASTGDVAVAGTATLHVRDGLEVVERVMKKYRPVTLPGLPRFTGGAVGFIGYEFIHDVEPVVPRPTHDELGTPTMYFIVADQLLVFDRVAQTITVLVNAAIDEAASPTDAYESAVEEIERLLSLLEQPSEHHPVSVPSEVPSVPFSSNQPKDKFLANVAASKKFITAGDIIQVVGSQRFSVETKASPVDVYRAARSVNPSPYMFLLELDGFSLVGASPEIHVRCEDSKVEIRPIAGTRRRGKTADEDVALEKELLADPKERAEHVMLVDLARNDIGRVCDFGSVQVKDLMIIERYSHVMHIVSSVEGRLSADKTNYDLMRATFPAGTVSGAPKIRAMQIIADLEGTTRGPYGGCVGYFSFNGNLDTCITIRTALLKDGKAYVQAGGGWVNDSEPEAEFQETVNKSKAMLKAVALAETFAKAQ